MQIMPTLMLRHPLRVFISSTATDLRAYRQAVHDALLLMEELPVEMAFFGAMAEDTIAVASIDKVAQADIVILLIAWRYGTIEVGQQQSYTHLEFEAARHLKKPLFVFLADPKTEDPTVPDGKLFPTDLRDPTHEQQLQEFREEAKRQKVVAYFTTPDDLATKVATALHVFLRDHPTFGPPRDMPPRSVGFVGRDHEVTQLQTTLGGSQHLRSAPTPAAMAVVGMGGIGKSSLASEVVGRFVADPQTFVGGITWVRCNERIKDEGLAWIYEQLMGAWYLALSPEESASATTPARQVEMWERLLRTRWQPPGPVLVLLDNVEHDLPVGRLVELLTTRGASVLLTTRTQLTHPAISLFMLDVLDPTAAVALFCERFQAKGGTWQAGRDQTPAAHVVAALGYLPLAIELAAARLARLRAEVQTLEQEVSESSVLRKLNDPSVPSGGAQYVLGRSLALLTSIRRRCFAALSLFDGPEMPQAIVRALFAGLLDQQEDRAVQAEEVLDEVVTLSLLTPIASADQEMTPRVRLHPLLREVAATIWREEATTIQEAGKVALLAGVQQYVLTQTDQKRFAVLAHDEWLITQVIRLAAKEQSDNARLVATIDDLETYLQLRGREYLNYELRMLQRDAYRALGNRRGEGGALSKLGVLAMSLGRLDEGHEDLQQALVLAREVNDRQLEGRTLRRMGGWADSQGKPAEAERYYSQALPIAQQEEDTIEETGILRALGVLAMTAGRLEVAREYYEQALALARKVGNRQWEAMNLFIRGWAAFLQGNYEQATPDFEQALILVREADDRYGEAQVLSNMGYVALNQGRFDQARQYFQQSMAIEREVDNKETVQYNFLGLGWLDTEQGNYEQAHQEFVQSVETARKNGDRLFIGRAGTWLGWGSVRQGNYEEAQQELAQAEQIIQEVGDPFFAGYIHNARGELALSQGKLAEAQQELEQYALMFFQQFGDQRGEAWALNNLGKVAEQGGDDETAIQYYERALPLMEHSYQPYVAEVRRRLEAVRQRVQGRQQNGRKPSPRRKWWWLRRHDPK
jgi:tetratricopeptide (TPR) repeat protein